MLRCSVPCYAVAVVWDYYPTQGLTQPNYAPDGTPPPYVDVNNVELGEWALYPKPNPEPIALTLTLILKPETRTS
jgi:hypothetical protein